MLLNSNSTEHTLLLDKWNHTPWHKSIEGNDSDKGEQAANNSSFSPGAEMVALPHQVEGWRTHWPQHLGHKNIK